MNSQIASRSLSSKLKKERRFELGKERRTHEESEEISYDISSACVRQKLTLNNFKGARSSLKTITGSAYSNEINVGIIKQVSFIAFKSTSNRLSSRSMIVSWSVPSSLACSSCSVILL